MNAEEAIQKVAWVKTDYIKPHEYFRRDNHPGAFHVISDAIKRHGVKGEFLGRQYRYWHFKEYRYWQMGGIIINRARIKPALAA